MNTSQMKYYLAVCEMKNFSASAEKLSITQQGLSKAIKSMEEELGITLFERSQSGLSLTNCGKYAQEHICHILNDFDSMTNHLRMMERENKNEITIALLDGFSKDATFGLHSALENLPDTSDAANIKIIEMSSAECEKAVSDETVDIGITLGPTNNPELDYYIFQSIRHYAIVNYQAPLADRKELSIFDLKDEPLIILNQHYKSFHLFMARCHEAKISPLIYATVSEVSSIFLPCILGKGIGIVPEFALKEIDSIPQLRAVPFGSEMTNPVYIISKKGQPLPVRVKKLFSVMQEPLF